MEKLSETIEKYLVPVASKIAQNRILNVIKSAMTIIISLLIIGSIAVLLTSFPVEAVANFFAPAAPFLNAIYNCTTGIMGLLAAASIAYYGAVEYGVDPISSVLTSVAAFLLTQISLDGTLDISGLGSLGLITAMIIGLVTVLLINFFKEHNLVIKMPDGVPQSVADSFVSLVPSIIILIVFGSFSLVFGLNLNDIIGTLFTPLAMIVNTPFGYALYHMLCCLVFFFGIQNGVIIGVVSPFILQLGSANEAAILAGQAAPNCITYATDSMIWPISSLGLVLVMLLFAKSRAFKTVSRTSILPAIFNIHEPVIFGTPIAFNPLFFIPFVFTPGIVAFLTFILTDLGVLIHPVISLVPWTIPPVAIGFFIGGGNIGWIIWSIVVILISMAINYPFFRIADKQELELEMGSEAAASNEEA